ncbi:MAG: hypothetical protein ACJZ2N_00520 [Candidatus Poseidoniales archaeon]
MDFEELVCYSQSVILLLLLIGYALKYRKQEDNKKIIKQKVSCPSCDFSMAGKDLNFCSKCGNSISHSTGLSLEK